MSYAKQPSPTKIFLQTRKDDDQFLHLMKGEIKMGLEFTPGSMVPNLP
jgi:hypothetical protein